MFKTTHSRQDIREYIQRESAALVREIVQHNADAEGLMDTIEVLRAALLDTHRNRAALPLWRFAARRRLAQDIDEIEIRLQARLADEAFMGLRGAALMAAQADLQQVYQNYVGGA